MASLKALHERSSNYFDSFANVPNISSATVGLARGRASFDPISATAVLAYQQLLVENYHPK